ncbi:DUF4190 domain-containing protein [Actinoplanes sp. NPDC049681]|uniref:DUF4190 domain-containing protein n=1 Tax=Actinoplanes sp. NPDC049681 TaxID=3363905 RepID=UPI0037ACF3DC
MTYPPTPGPDGIQPPPPDPPVQAYQPPQAYPLPAAYAPPPAYQPPVAQDPYAPYGQPASPYAYSPYPPAARPTEGMAIASLVISCVAIAGLCVWGIGFVLGVLGAIFGHVARGKIRRSGAGGDGMALAGIIIGWVVTALGLAFIALLAMAIISDSSTA